MQNPIQGMGAIFYKEVRHMRRDPMAVMFALMMPVGLMIDTRRSYRYQHPASADRNI